MAARKSGSDTYNTGKFNRVFHYSVVKNSRGRLTKLSPVLQNFMMVLQNGEQILYYIQAILFTFLRNVSYLVTVMGIQLTRFGA